MLACLCFAVLSYLDGEVDTGPFSVPSGIPSALQPSATLSTALPDAGTNPYASYALPATGGPVAAYAGGGKAGDVEDDYIPMAVALHPPPGDAGGFVPMGTAVFPAGGTHAPVVPMVPPTVHTEGASATAPSSSTGASGGYGPRANNPYANPNPGRRGAAPAPAHPAASATSGAAERAALLQQRASSLQQHGAAVELPKDVLKDASELTRFALAALAAGEADLAVQHLRGALGVLGR